MLSPVCEHGSVASCAWRRNLRWSGGWHGRRAIQKIDRRWSWSRVGCGMTSMRQPPGTLRFKVGGIFHHLSCPTLLRLRGFSFVSAPRLPLPLATHHRGQAVHKPALQYISCTHSTPLDGVSPSGPFPSNPPDHQWSLALLSPPAT